MEVCSKNGAENRLIGAHVSAEPDVSYSPIYAHEIGARAFAIFTAPQDSWNPKDPSPQVCETFKENCNKYSFKAGAILPHAGFMMNPGSPDKRKLAMSRKMLTNELRRCELLGLTMLNFHPGASLGQIEENKCLDTIAESINIALEQTHSVKAVIENTAGQGSNLGWNFEQIAYIIDKIEDKSRVGVCIDTCHAFAAGYDFSTEEGYTESWKKFDDIIGSQYLCGMHLNDSKRGLGSRIDRHESIGEGAIGREFFKRLVCDPRTANIPLILETPDEDRWRQEVADLYGMTDLS